MRTVAIIQARMQSRRLPGKVLKLIGEKPLLQVLIERVRLARSLDEVIVATGETPANNPIITLAQSMGSRSFVGSEDDVLDRFVKAAEWVQADVVVRVTADNPLTEPTVIDALVAVQAAHHADLVLADGLIDGAESEVTTVEALCRARRTATMPAHREHVTLLMKEQPQLFMTTFWAPPAVMRRPDLSVTVDTTEQFERVRVLYEALQHEAPWISWGSITAWLDQHGTPSASKLARASD